MSPKDAMEQIRSITAELISAGMIVDQNFPSAKRVGLKIDIGFSGQESLSATLRNVPYAVSYEALREARAFNFVMIDGSIVQMLYSFSKGMLTKHRLAFFPSPDLLEYQNSPEIYDDDDLYGDVVDKGVVTSPIRFDFDPSNFIELEHPSSHLTIGQYKNCRIPVSGPITPQIFCAFILRSFYNTPFRKFLPNFSSTTNTLPVTIVKSEQMALFVGVHG